MRFPRVLVDFEARKRAVSCVAIFVLVTQMVLPPVQLLVDRSPGARAQTEEGEELVDGEGAGEGTEEEGVGEEDLLLDEDLASLEGDALPLDGEELPLEGTDQK